MEAATRGASVCKALLNKLCLGTTDTFGRGLVTDFPPRRSTPSLKRWLLRVHRDLQTIDAVIDPYAGYYRNGLSNYERLVLVLEDRRFFGHGGFEIWAIIREFLRMFASSPHGGASTIDMQFVRTATGYKQISFRRKLYEMLLSSLIQFRYPKIVILRSYLQIAYLGHALKGADAAAMKAFGKFSDELSPREAAHLATYLVFPRPSDALTNHYWQRRVLRRANHIEAFYIRNEKRFNKLERRVFGNVS